MRLQIKLFASFRDDRFVEKMMDYPETTKVGDIVEDLQIEHETIGVIMINGRHSSVDTALHDGDTLAIFPLVGGG